MSTVARKVVTEDHRQRALVVDDEEVTRLLASSALERVGLEVQSATNGSEALDAFVTWQPDIVLMDVKMPVMDGFTACARLRERVLGKHTPLLMMTGLDDVGSIRRAYEVGATDFINKPINWVVLGHRVEYMLRASQVSVELRENRTKLENAHRIAGLGHWEWDLGSGLVSYSRETREILGLEGSEPVEGYTLFVESVHPDDSKAVIAFVRDHMAGEQPTDVEYRVVRPDGSERQVVQKAEAVFGGEGRRPARISGVLQDITERREAEAKIRYMAYYDGLTGLPNRRAFAERLDLELAGARRTDQMTATLFLNIDRFQRINDTLGHRAGDQLLQMAADRLTASVRSTDVVSRVADKQAHLVARFGGDEFVVLLGGLTRAEDVAAVARRLSEVLSEPLLLGEHEVFLTSSIGISVSPEDGADAETLLKNADTAMHHAKERGRSNTQYYSGSMNDRALERLTLESGLSNALDRDELVLYYQPQFAAASGQMVGVEALLRWNHPVEGILPPSRFIGLSEETGLIVPIGEWVLRQACEQAKAWLEGAPAPLRMAVNLSSRQFLESDFLAAVERVLLETGLDPALLDLELTEGSIMQEGEETVASLEALKAMGVRLSVDDFGTGYSSLSYLRRFPLDALKIDRSFVQGLPADPDHAAIVRAILAMAGSLNLAVVAEGVETSEQRTFLCREGCDELQGYLLGRPVPAEEIGWLLEESVREPPLPFAVSG